MLAVKAGSGVGPLSGDRVTADNGEPKVDKASRSVISHRRRDRVVPAPLLGRRLHPVVLGSRAVPSASERRRLLHVVSREGMSWLWFIVQHRIGRRWRDCVIAAAL